MLRVDEDIHIDIRGRTWLTPIVPARAAAREQDRFRRPHCLPRNCRGPSE